jgi:hypothetical protein
MQWGGQEELSPEEQRQEEIEKLAVEEHYLHEELQEVLARAKTLSRTRNSLILEGQEPEIAMIREELLRPANEGGSLMKCLLLKQDTK